MPDVFKSSTPPTPTPQGHALSSFCVLPKNVSFQAQNSDEQIILLLRPHIITNLGWFLTTLLAILVPLAAYTLFPDLSSYISAIPSRFFPVITIVYFLGLALYVLSHLIAWFYNIFLVTNQRVVDIDYDNVMYQDIAITKLQEIEDVHYTQSGFFASLFNYGDIDIQTEANKPNFEAEKVPNPSYAANLMASYIEKERNN